MVYHFLIGVSLSVFILLGVWTLVHQIFDEGQGEVFAYGFLCGGLVLGAVFGSFDQENGGPIAAGMAAVIVGTALFSRFRKRKKG